MTHVRPYIGQVCWTTTSAPGGLVTIAHLTAAPWGDGRLWAQVWHVLDHPAGYGRGLGWWVPLCQLQPCAWPEAEDDA